MTEFYPQSEAKEMLQHIIIRGGCSAVLYLLLFVDFLMVFTEAGDGKKAGLIRKTFYGKSAEIFVDGCLVIGVKVFRDSLMFRINKFKKPAIFNNFVSLYFLITFSPLL